MNSDLILRVGTKLVMPFVLLFALYVQFHGDYSPGGGFQAGVIASAAVFLIAITFGMRQAKMVAPPAVVQFMVPLGVLIFAGAGLLGLLFGRAFLDYAVLGADPVRSRELGILIAEFGVLVTVAGTVMSLFYAFAERGRQ